jgi:hypothetical protein
MFVLLVRPRGRDAEKHCGYNCNQSFHVLKVSVSDKRGQPATQLARNKRGIESRARYRAGRFNYSGRRSKTAVGRRSTHLVRDNRHRPFRMAQNECIKELNRTVRNQKRRTQNAYAFDLWFNQDNVGGGQNCRFESRAKSALMRGFVGRIVAVVSVGGRFGLRMVIVGIVRMIVAEPGFCGAKEQRADPRHQHDGGDAANPFR